MGNRSLNYFKGKAGCLKIEPREMMSISRFSANAPRAVNRVLETEGRVILTKNGVPVAGVVPLWMLLIVERHLSTDYDPGITDPITGMTIN